MKDWLGFWFEGSRCDSEFAHFGLMVLLIILAYSFAWGVMEEFQEKDDTTNIRDSVRLTGIEQSINKLIQRDFSELQREEELKQDLLDCMQVEEDQEYDKIIPYESKEINAKIFSKTKGLYVRLDINLEVSGQKAFKLLQDVEQWPILCKNQDKIIVQCVKNQQIDTLKSGLEVFHMELIRDSENFSFVYKRWIRIQNQSLIIMLSSRGLENYEAKKQKKRINIDLIGFKFYKVQDDQEKMFVLIKQSNNPVLSEKEKLQSTTIALMLVDIIAAVQQQVNI